jgi:hypothetical protein
MEAAMRGLFDRSDETARESIYRSWRIGIFALPVLLVTALVALLIAHPDLPNRIMEAAKAGFGNSGTATKAAPVGPVQPARDVRGVKAN